MNPMRVVSIIIVVVLGLVAIFAASSFVEFNDAGHIIVIQYPAGGLKVGFTPGPYAQWFGTVTKYQKRDQFDFNCPKGKDAPDNSLGIPFNDGGRGKVCGTIAWENPSDEKAMLALHTKYRSHQAIEQQLIRPVVAKSIAFAGPLMSSTESYASRRSDLLSAIEDQIDGGVYRTESQQVRMKDVMTGVERTVTQVTMVKDEKTGVILRQDRSPFDDFGIRTFNLAIDHIEYEDAVKKQIAQQQDAFAKVNTAVARAKEAEQDAITAEQRGKADAATAKWKQEVVKATEVTLAQQKLEVATLAAKEAAEYKRQQVLIGEGDAERRKLVMAADGALDRKLEAYVQVQEKWARAFADFKGEIVPRIVQGSGAQTGNAALNFMEIMGIKAAQDLAVDVKARGNTAPVVTKP
jgi:regulator of protease activity HflC (stomatin/prohibitin superfamily)